MTPEVIEGILTGLGTSLAGIIGAVMYMRRHLKTGNGTKLGEEVKTIGNRMMMVLGMVVNIQDSTRKIEHRQAVQEDRQIKFDQRLRAIEDKMYR